MKTWKLVLLSAAVMLGLPWLAVTFVPGDAGMAACFLLFFAVDPIYAVIAGIAAGTNGKRLWFLPILTALLFLAGAWMRFAPMDPAFLMYAAAYLLLGLLSMAITAAVCKRRAA